MRKASLPDVAELSSRILDVYQRAPVGARSWYHEAHAYAEDLSREYGVTLEQACGVIAALSPNLSWDKNVAYARQLLATGDAPVLGGSKRKALRIVQGERPLDVLSGHKVVSFYFNLLWPDTSDSVTIDRHAHDVAVGKRYGNRYRPLLRAKGGYERLAEAYRHSADVVGITPSEMQAATWTAWREAA